MGQMVLTTESRAATSSPTTVDADWLVAQFDDHSARGIAQRVAHLIEHEQLRPGLRLPTTRVLAEKLGVSPATISAAWRQLVRRRLVTSNRRRGTVVSGSHEVLGPHRFETLGRYQGIPKFDLRLCAPDPNLLPPVANALRRSAANSDLASYERTLITPQFEAAARLAWPSDSESFLAVSGGFDGLLAICRCLIAPGDRVAVEQPGVPRLLDILDSLDADILPVVWDEEGPVPESLEVALRHTPKLFIYQPANQSPTGRSVTAERSNRLAELLEDTNTIVVEDDGLGLLSPVSFHSVADHLPDRTLIVRSFSKSHGPDLRLAVIGGPDRLIQRVHSFLEFGAGWTSRLLQNALAELLMSPTAAATVQNALDTYAQRRLAVANGLEARGVPVSGHSGLFVWVPVGDETSALVTLTSGGVLVVPGSRYYMKSGPPAIRIATSRLRASSTHDELLDLIALAAERDCG